MKTRRTFLKTIAAIGAAAALPRFAIGAPGDLAPFPAAPNFFTSPRVSALISGGTITKDGKLLPSVSAAHKLHYGATKNILLILHASIPADRDGAEKKIQAILTPDGYAAESLHHYEGRAALKKIEEADAFFVGGGETFLLLRTLNETGQFALLREKVLAGAIYNGSSAGANIAGLNIGCTNDFPVVDVPTRAALGFFPCVFNPHHPKAGEAEYAGRVGKIRGYRRLNPSEIVLGVGNGSVVRLHAGKVTVEAGPVFIYEGEAAPRELALGEIPELTKLVG